MHYLEGFEYGWKRQLGQIRVQLCAKKEAWQRKEWFSGVFDGFIAAMEQQTREEMYAARK